jgi:tellurite methyltransferase
VAAGDAERWNAKWAGAEAGPPAEVLRANAHLLPREGRALDLACGLGSNALLLAERGLDVEAWDVSEVAIEAAQARHGSIVGRVVDALQSPPPASSFDVIVMTRFLERELAPALVEALKPGGLLFTQTFAQTKVHDRGPRRDEWRLADGELLRLYSGLDPVVYREEGRLGDLSVGFRDEALLVARKPIRN